MIGELHFANDELIHLVWVAAALVAALALLEARGRDALGRFLSAVMQTRLATRISAERRAVRLSLIALCLVLGILALMRPQTRPEPETAKVGEVTGDIMIALDVSRSMLAEDAAPTRLARAKAEISELVSNLKGHRVGLVAFAGRATVLAPLTNDYGFFRLILRGADTRSVSRGGTRIGDALRSAIDAFGPGRGSRLILLITDGEDHDSYPMDAAKAAKEADIRVVGIGFGSEDGSEITLVDPDTGARSLLTDNQGNVVRSRLDGALLRDIALETDGAYVPAGVAALDLKSIVDQRIEPMVQESAETRTRVVPREQYTWFVLGSLLALLAAAWIGSASASAGGRQP